MTTIHTQIHDGIETRYVLNANCYIKSEYGLFLGNMLLYGTDKLQVYHLKPDNVPQFFKDNGVTDATLAATVQEWYELAKEELYAFSLDDCFPQRYLGVDFDKEDLNETLEVDVAALQTAVEILDSTFSTDSERVAAVTALQDQLDIALADRAAIRQEIDDDVLVEKNAREAEEVLIRQELAAGDDAIRGASVAPEYDTLKKIEVIVKAEILQTDSDLDIERARILLLENRYDDVTVDQKIDADVLVETQRSEGQELLIRQEFAAADLLKADQSTTYTKNAVDGFINDRQTTAIQESLYRKKADSYIKSQVDGKDTVLQDQIDVEKLRIDGILNLGPQQLANFAAVEAAYQAADGVVSSALSSIINGKVSQSTYDTAQDAQDVLIAANVTQADYDIAIAARQTTAAQELAYRKIADSHTKAEVQTKIDTVQADVDANESSAAVFLATRFCAEHCDMSPYSSVVRVKV